jgi:gluconate 2-dehydrogenase gamma chain
MFLKTRRTFLKTGFLTAALLLFPGGRLWGAVSPLDTIGTVQGDLYADLPGLPGFERIDAGGFLAAVLRHSRIGDGTKAFIRNGVQWLNEEALQLYKKRYHELEPDKRQKVLEAIVSQGWGEEWLYTLLSHFFEAILGDPVYGGNPQGAGWRWLNHTPGLPRPKKALA